MVGAAFLGWGGAALSAQIGLTGWSGFILGAFAVGIACMAYAPVAALEDRVRELEARLAAHSANSTDKSSAPAT
jgi:hypothetical protein